MRTLLWRKRRSALRGLGLWRLGMFMATGGPASRSLMLLGSSGYLLSAAPRRKLFLPWLKPVSKLPPDTEATIVFAAKRFWPCQRCVPGLDSQGIIEYQTTPQTPTTVLPSALAGSKRMLRLEGAGDEGRVGLGIGDAVDHGYVDALPGRSEDLGVDFRPFPIELEVLVGEARIRWQNKSPALTGSARGTKATGCRGAAGHSGHLSCYPCKCARSTRRSLSMERGYQEVSEAAGIAPASSGTSSLTRGRIHSLIRRAVYYTSASKFGTPSV